jgi:hypothetical protein
MRFRGSRPIGVELQLLSKTCFANLRPVTLILLAAVSFILLIAGRNLANTMLACSARASSVYGRHQGQVRRGEASRRARSSPLLEAWPGWSLQVC